MTMTYSRPQKKKKGNAFRDNNMRVFVVFVGSRRTGLCMAIGKWCRLFKRRQTDETRYVLQ